MAAIDGLYLSLIFPEPPPDRPFVYINMVATVDGKITVDGSERGIGSEADKRLFYELRAHAGAVLDGAATARLSGASPRVRPPDLQRWRRDRGQAAHPLGVLLTASGNLPLDSAFFTSEAFEAAVFAAETIPAERLAALRHTRRPVHLVPAGDSAVPAMLQVLHQQYGVQRLLCEGGGTLNSTFIHQGLADELFLSIAPKIAGGRDNLTAVEGEPFHRDTMPALELMSWHHHLPTGEVFTRWRFQRPATATGGSP